MKLENSFSFFQNFFFSRFRFENNGHMQPTLWRHRRLQSEIRALRVCIQ
jgi:hypothetical protein